MKFIHQHKFLFVFLTVLFIIGIVCLFSFFLGRYERGQVLNELHRLDLDSYHKLMIVAHPDDEMLWGGTALIEDNYLVVCVTCGSNKIRVKEFKSVMKKTHDKYLMLYYPDKVLYKRSKWKYEYKYIKNDIRKIIDYKDWDLIVTHNKYGEYGHMHHKMTHDIVLDSLGVKNRDKFRTFNRYCSLNKLTSGNCGLEVTVDDELVGKKAEILYQYYGSQANTINLFKHMLSYEALNKE